MACIENIFIAPARDAPVRSLTTVEAIAGCGLQGDRYANQRNRKDDGQQLTLIEAEAIEQFVTETGLAMRLDEPRRNLVTRGIDLNALVGRYFRIGDCELEGVELCEPCGKWARNTHREVMRFFLHRGGLNARIVTGGTIDVAMSIAARKELK